MSILNQYAKITALTTTSATLSATVRYPKASPPALAPGDPVLIFIMNGHGMKTPTGPNDTDDPTFGDYPTDPVRPPQQYFRTTVLTFDSAQNRLTFAAIPEL